MCCYLLVTSARLIGTKGLIEATIDGLTFHRSKSSAAARLTPRTYQVEWAEVAEAGLTEPAAGKPFVWITVLGEDATDGAPDSGLDPYAMKVRRRDRHEAREFVRVVNVELAVRQRWNDSREPEASSFGSQ